MPLRRFFGGVTEVPQAWMRAKSRQPVNTTYLLEGSALICVFGLATLLGVSPIASFIVATSGGADGKFDGGFSSGTQTYAEPARTRYVG